MRRPRNRAGRAGHPDAAAFDAKHPRAAGGRFGEKADAAAPAAQPRPRALVGEERLKTSGVAANDEIVLISSRLRSYKPGASVRDFVDGHPKGRAYALRKLAADHKKGAIGFKGTEPAAQPPSAKPAPVSNASAEPVVAKQEVKPPEIAGTQPHGALRARLEQAYLKLTSGRTGQAVRLSALRSELSDLDRKTVDGALLRIAGGDKDGAGGAVLSQFSNPKTLDAAERAAAFSPAGEPFHILWLNKRHEAAKTEPSTAAGVKRWLRRGDDENPYTAADLRSLRQAYDAAGLDMHGIDEPAVFSYAGGGYSEINDSLRHGRVSKSFSSDIDKLDDLISKSSFKVDTLMYRGFGSKATTLHGAPPPDRFIDDGFTSVSFSPAVAEQFAHGGALYRVRVPKGFPGIALSREYGDVTQSLKDEAEVLLPRGTTYRVVKRTRRAAYNGEYDVVDVEPVLPERR